LQNNSRKEEEIMEKSALITGSSSGLGLDITKFLIESGYTVFGGSRSGTDFEHENFYDVELDLTSEDSVEEFFETIREFTPSLDVVVNNAGICEMTPISETTLEQFEAHLATNTTGPFLLFKYLEPFLIKNETHIISILSTAARYGYPNVSAYNASKFGQLGLIESLKKEWKEACNNAKISTENGRKGSPFVGWKELESAAEDFNHRVVSIEEDGFEDVYNGTVDEFHNFFIGGVESVQSNGKKKWSYFNNLQCGEIWLTEYDCCCLGAIVLPRFVKNGTVDWQELKKTVATSVRFLDNTLTANNYPLPEIKETCSNIRRVGLGVMGIHDLLIEMGLKYNSDVGLELIDKVMETIKNAAYETSIELAREKGSFPKFNRCS